jgi:hypothetical protein
MWQGATVDIILKIHIVPLLWRRRSNYSRGEGDMKLYSLLQIAVVRVVRMSGFGRGSDGAANFRITQAGARAERRK